MRSAEIIRPGFVHDLYAMNQNLFLRSPVYRDFKTDLARHGLRYAISDKPYSSAFPGGKCLRVYRDFERTLEVLRRHCETDAEAWLRMYNVYRALAENLAPLLQSSMPSVAAGRIILRAARRLGRKELFRLLQTVTASIRELCDEHGATPELQALVAAWGMHLDLAPDIATGAIFPLLECFADMESGLAVAEGGASRMPEALSALLQEYGGTVRTEAEVTRILVSGNRAAGVELVSGERIEARRAVVANLTPVVLFGRLLQDATLPMSFRKAIAAYRYGPGTMMIHLALSKSLQWDAGEDLNEFAYVHVAPYLEDLARTYSDSLAGFLPASPFLVVGQTSAVDPSRAPGPANVLWVQVRSLPREIRGDARDEIQGRSWADTKEAFADRVMNKLEDYAPGATQLILDRVVASPADLERSNPNLVGGDSGSGSHHLRQNFIFRPVSGWSRYRMPIAGLYMVGAATWPGAGCHATSGYLAAQRMLG